MAEPAKKKQRPAPIAGMWARTGPGTWRRVRHPLNFALPGRAVFEVASHETDHVGVRRRTCPLLERRWKRDERAFWRIIDYHIGINGDEEDEDGNQIDRLPHEQPPALRLYCLRSHDATYETGDMLADFDVDTLALGGVDDYQPPEQHWELLTLTDRWQRADQLAF